MKQQKIRVTLLVCGLVAVGSVLLIAQAGQAQKTEAKPNNKGAKTGGTHNNHHSRHTSSKPGPVSHPFGPTTIHVNVAACELQEPMIHADPEANHGKVLFEQINGTKDVTLNISDGVLKQDQVTVPAHGQVPVEVKGDVGDGTITFAKPCTPQPIERKKGQHVLNDPNEILVP